MYMENGNIYKGGYKNDARNGPGIYKNFSTGEQYEGEWKDNLKNGYGVFIYAYGDRYEGNW